MGPQVVLLKVSVGRTVSRTVRRPLVVSPNVNLNLLSSSSVPSDPVSYESMGEGGGGVAATSLFTVSNGELAPRVKSIT